MHRLVILWIALLVPATVGRACAAPETASLSPEVAAVIGQGVRVFTEAYNAADAQTIADQFHNQGEFIDAQGRQFQGRQAVGDEFRRFFQKNSSARIHINLESLHQLTPNLILEEGTAETSYGTGTVPDRVRYIVVHAQQGDTWRIAYVRNHRQPPTNYERLQPLSWTVGDWVDEATSSLITSHCHWSPDRHYLLREFSVKVDGHDVLSDTTHIGWDPRAQQIRSWVFDNRGGYDEGLWTQVGNRWIIKLHGIQRNGDTVSAAQQYLTITKIDPQDSLSEGLAQMLSDDPTDGQPPVPLLTSSGQQQGTVPAPRLRGTWTAHREDGSTFQLVLGANGRFTWKFTGDAKTDTFSGTYSVVDNLLVLQ